MNTAGRIYSVMGNARSSRQGELAIDGWTLLFNLSKLADPHREHAVARRLALLQAQLVSLRADLGDRAKNATFSEHLQRAEHAFSLRRLNEQWKQVREYLPDETYKIFGVIAELLPEEEAPELSAIEAFLTEIDAIAQAVTDASTGLSDDFLRFLRQQIAILRQAVEEYGIGGPEVIREMADRAAQQWVDEHELVSEHINEEFTQLLLSMWNRLRSVGGKTIKFGMIATWLLVDLPQAGERLTHIREIFRVSPSHASEDTPTPSTPAQRFEVLPSERPRLRP